MTVTYMHKLAVWSIGVWLLCLALMAQANPLPDTLTQIKPSIVGVGSFMSLRRPQSQLWGTGFIVADGRYAVTNAHVIKQEVKVDRGENLVIFTGTGRNSRWHKVKVLVLDKVHDLALLEIDGSPLPALQLGNSRQVREGEYYAFTGFPIGAVLGLYPVTHRAIISSITPLAIPAPSSNRLNATTIRRLKNPYSVFQLDATAYPGNSGSPLYDMETGHVIGVLNMVFVKESKEAILQRPSGISYAIPARYVEKMLSQAKIKPDNAN